MGIKAFFKSFGSVLGKILGIIHKIVPDEVLDHGIDLVAQAGKKFVDNAEKREWVVVELMKLFPIPEYIARLVVELAVTQAKHAIDKGDETAKAND